MSLFKKDRLAKVEAAAASSGPRNTVLIVDDEEANLRVLRAVLGDGFRVIEAKDGQAALELLESLPPEDAPALILSDQRMPRMTGVEMFERLREKLPSSIRIIITGFVDVGAIVEAINRAGIYKFVVKPFDQNQLRLEVDRAIEVSEARARVEREISELRHQVGENTRRLEQSIEALRRAHAEIERAGLTDELTGLGNRRSLLNALDGREAGLRLSAQAQGPGARSAFVLVAIDHLAAVNDRFGDAAGNALLRGVADALRGLCREGDFAVRWDGPAFLMHLGIDEESQALEQARRVRAALAAATFDIGDGRRMRSPCSIGVVAWPFAGVRGGWEQALALAEAALRLARRFGGNTLLSLAPTGELPEDVARRLAEDPEPLLDSGLIRAHRDP